MNVFLGYGAEDNHFCVELTYSESSYLAHIQSSCFHMQTDFVIYSLCLQNMLHVVVFMVDYGVTKYDIGAALGHFGIAVPNVSINFPIFVQFIDTEMTANL